MTELNTIKLEEIINISGKLTLLSGLYIGAGDSDLRIGGIDSSVVKDSKDFPYIPGSSIKGKVRTLLEWDSGLLTDGKPLDLDTVKDNSNGKLIVELFGQSAGAKNKALPTRAIFADSSVVNENNDYAINFYEDKAENTINRITTIANPRHLERVKSGTSFLVNVSIRIFSEDRVEDFLDLLAKGFALLELDYLGGGGSRGSGKVEFSFEDHKDFQDLIKKQKDQFLKHYRKKS